MIIPGLDVHPLLAERDKKTMSDPSRGGTVADGTAPGEAEIMAANRALGALADLDFEVGSEYGKPVVRIIDASSGRVIRRIPGEEMAELSRKMKALNGLLTGSRA